MLKKKLKSEQSCLKSHSLWVTLYIQCRVKFCVNKNNRNSVLGSRIGLLQVQD